MILFLISFLLIGCSSCLLASVFEAKKYLSGLIYTMLITFAQVVLTIEVLSLFKAISKIGILFINIVCFLVVLMIWVKNGKKLYRPKFKEFLKKIIGACNRDKMLYILGSGFIFFILVSIVLCIIMPVVSYDALAYHFNRALFWVSQGSLAHFDIADDRNIVMPINSEILYTWFLTFVPKNWFIGFFSFAGYILMIVSLYSFLEINGFCVRKRLWAVFLISSIAGILMEASGVETNIIVSGLALACISLFLQGTKSGKITPIYFSSLAFALAVGTKTTSFFIMPSVALIFIYFLLRYQKEKFWCYSGSFIGFAIINFLIFSAYNYVLNFIEFGNFAGSPESILHHCMSGGLKGYLSGFIRHCILLFDFSGFSYSIYLQKWVFAVQDKLLTMLGIPLDLNVIFSNENTLNLALNDSVVGGGVIGILVLVPCAIIAIFKGIFYPKCKNNQMLALFGLSLFLSIAVMSGVIGFMLFSARFLNTFLALSAPVLVLSYIKSNKNIFKYLILFYVMSYFLLISTHMWSRHVVNMVKELVKGQTISDVRTKHLCTRYIGYTGKMPYCTFRSILYKLPKGSKIGIFSANTDNVAVLKLMEADGYKIDTLLVSEIFNYDLKSYDYLVFTKRIIDSSYAKSYSKIFDNYYIDNGQLKLKDSNLPFCIVSNTKGSKSILLTKADYGKITPTQVTCEIPTTILEKMGYHKIIRVLYGEHASKNPNGEDVEELNVYKRN